MTEMMVPTLVRGAWHPGTGVGCAMQLRNWMKAGGQFRGFNKSRYAQLSDRRDSMHSALNAVVIAVNDTYCSHLTKMTVCDPNTLKTHEVDRLCAECTMWLLELVDIFDDTAMLDRVASRMHMNELDSISSTTMLLCRQVVHNADFGPSFVQDNNRYAREAIKSSVNQLVRLVKLAKEQATEIPEEPTPAQQEIDRKFADLTKVQAMLHHLNAAAEHAKAASKKLADLNAKAKAEIGT